MCRTSDDEYKQKKKKRARFTWEKVEDLKMEHCYITPDYGSEARLFQVSQFVFHPYVSQKLDYVPLSQL